MVLPAASGRSRRHADEAGARRPARRAPAHLLSNAPRSGTFQGGALSPPRRPVPRRPVRRARRRPRRRRDDDAAPAFRFRPRQSHLRRHHPGRLADVASAAGRVALRRRRRRRPRVSRRRHRPSVVCGAPGSRVAPRSPWSGDGGHDPRVRRRERSHDGRRLLPGSRRGPHQGSDFVDAAWRRVRAPGASLELPERSGLRQLQRAHRAGRRQGGPRSVTETGHVIHQAEYRDSWSARPRSPREA